MRYRELTLRTLNHVLFMTENPKTLLRHFYLLLFAAIGLNLPSPLKAQHPYRSALTFELGGTAIGYAIGWEQICWQSSSSQWSLRAGIGLLPLTLYLPFSSEFVFLPGDHHLVAGISASASLETSQRFKFDRQSSDTFLTLGAILGYRWQPRDRRIFIQTSVNPGIKLDPTPTQLVSADPISRFAVGLALGYFLF